MEPTPRDFVDQRGPVQALRSSMETPLLPRLGVQDNKGGTRRSARGCLRKAAEADVEEEDGLSGRSQAAQAVEEDEGSLKDSPPTEPSPTLISPEKKKTYDPEKNIAKERYLLVSKPWKVLETMLSWYSGP